MKNKLKRLLSFVLALAMLLASMSSPVLADEIESEILSESSVQVQVDGDAVLNADDFDIDNDTETIQKDENIQEQSYSDTLVNNADERENAAQSDSEDEVYDSSLDTGSNMLVSNDNTGSSVDVEDAVLTQSESDDSPEVLDGTAADMLLTEEDSDIEGFRKIKIDARAEGNKNTNFRIYFWEYDGSLPLNPKDWNDYFTAPCENIVIDGLNETTAAINLPIVRSNGSDVYIQATFLNEYREKDQKLQSVYLDFTLEAGAVMDADIYVALQNINDTNTYVMAEAACAVNNEDAENERITLDYLDLTWYAYDDTVEADISFTESDAESEDGNNVAKGENESNIVSEDMEPETELNDQELEFVYETDDNSIDADADVETIDIDANKSIEYTEYESESAGEYPDDEFEVLTEEFDDEFELLSDNADGEFEDDEFTEETEAETEDIDDEFESPIQYDFLYDNFKFELVNYELPINENGYLSSDAQIALSADRAGDIYADTLTVQMDFTIPDGIICPESLTISANKVKDQNNKTWFEFTKSAGTKNSVQIDDAVIDDNVISLSFTVTGSDDLFAGWQIAMYGSAMQIENFESSEDTEIDMIELSVSADLSAENYGSIGFTAENRIYVGTIDESVNDVQELLINPDEYDWIQVIPEDKDWSLDYSYNGTITSFHTRYLDEVSDGLMELFVPDGISIQTDSAFYCFPESKQEDCYMKFKDIFYGTDTEGHPYKCNAKVYFWSYAPEESVNIGVLSYNPSYSSSILYLTGSPMRVRRQDQERPESPENTTFYTDTEWHFYDQSVGDGYTEEIFPSGFLKATDNDTNEGEGRTSAIEYVVINEDNVLKVNETDGDISSYVVGAEDTNESPQSYIYLLFSTSSSNPLRLSYVGRDALLSTYSSANYTIHFNVDNAPKNATIPEDKYVAEFVNTTEYYDVLAPQDDIDGYIFNGWYTDKDLTQKWTGSVSTQDDVQLYAEYIPLCGNLTVTKAINGVDSTDNEFTFTLSGTSLAGDYVEMSHTFSGITGSESYTFEDVPIGDNYTLTETYDENAWTSNLPSLSISIDADRTTGEPVTSTIAVTNTARKGNLTITKTIDTGDFYDIGDDYDPFVFTLTGTADNGTELDESFYFFPDDFHNGSASITFEDLYVGTYYLTELTDLNRDFWWTSAYKMSAPVYPDSDNTISLTNHLKRGSITIYKTLDIDDFDLADLGTMKLQFSLDGTADIGCEIHNQSILDEYSFADNQAKITFDGVPYGSYYITETILDGDTVWKVSGDASQPVTLGSINEEVYFENTLKTGNLKVVKYLSIDSQYDINDFDDAEFTFTLSGTSYAGVKVQDTVTINLSDFADSDYIEAVFNDIPIGIYSVTETISGSAAPAWSVSDNPEQDDIEVSDEYDNSVFFTNVLNYGSVCVNKTLNIGQASADTFKDAENFTFVLSGTATAGFPYTVTNTMTASDFSGTSGKITFDDVPVGSYQITEVLEGTVADMWGLDGDATQNVPVSANETIDVFYTNNLTSGTLTVTKKLDFGNYDASDVDDMSFTFSLKADGNDSIEERTVTFDSDDFTNDTASFTFDNVLFGDYIVTEIMDDSETAGWAAVSEKEQKVSVDSSNTDPEVDFENALRTGNLKVVKYLKIDSQYDLKDFDDAEFTFTLSGTSYAGVQIQDTVSVNLSDFVGSDYVEAVFNNIPVGSYSVTETINGSAAPAWSVSGNPVRNNIEVSDEYDNSVDFTNVLNYGSVCVNKTLDVGSAQEKTFKDAENFTFVLSGTATAGFEFTASVTMTSSDFTGTVGKITFDDVPVGSYKITEVLEGTAADMWAIDGDATQSVPVSANETTDVFYTNNLTSGTLTVTKELDFGNYDASDVDDMSFTFSLKADGNDSIEERTFTLDADDFTNGTASVTFDDVIFGSYVVTEITDDSETASWTAVSGKEQTVTVDASNADAKVTFKNKLNTGSLSLTKVIEGVDSTNNQFTFVLSGTSSAGIKVNLSHTFNGINGSETYVFEDVPVGDNYTLTETYDTQTWISDSVSKSVKITADSETGNGNTTDITVTNTEYKDDIEVVKVLKTGKYDPSQLTNYGPFEFTLTGTSNAGSEINLTEYAYASDFVQDSASVIFENVPAGTYKVTETSDGSNGLWTAESYSGNVTVAPGSTGSVKFTNQLNCGTVTVTKTLDIGNIGLKDLNDITLTFTLDGTSDTGIVINESQKISSSSFTDNHASVSFSEIPYGTYHVTETMSEDTSVAWKNKGDDSEPVVIDNGNTDAEVDFENTLRTGNLRVVKYLDIDAKYDLNDFDDAEFTFTLSGTSYAGVQVNETTSIHLSDFIGSDYVEAVFNNIPVGSYSVTETINGNAAPAWSVSDNPVQNDIEVSDEYDNTVYFTNVLNYGSVCVNKTLDVGLAPERTFKDAENFTFVLSGTATAGFDFTVSKTMTSSNFTGTFGTLTFDDVPVGSYKITEELDGVAADVWEIDGDASQSTPVSADENTDVFYTNILTTGTVTITKELDFGNYDASEVDDIDFTFALKSSENDSIAERTVTLDYDDFTDGTASATFENVIFGDYTVTEIMDESETASWSAVNGKEQAVTVYYADIDAEVKFKNKLNTGSLSLTKLIDGVASTDNEFTFVLSGTSSAGIEINLSHTFSGINGADTYVFKDIPVGSNYTLTETYDTQTWTSDSLFQHLKITVNSETGKGNTTDITVTNTARKGDIEVVKVLKTGKYSSSQLSDYGPFEFTLTGTSNAGTEIKRTKYAAAADFKQGSASIVFENVPVGTYTVAETSEGSNGLWTAESYSEDVTVSPNYTEQVKFTNQLNCGTVAVTKTLDVGNTGLKTLNDMTLTFTLEGTSDTGIYVNEYSEISYSDFTDNRASVLFSGIPYGTYHVTETMSDETASAWKNKGSESQPVVIEAEKTDAEVDFENTLKTGTLNVVKYLDIDSKYDTNDLSDVQFAFILYGTSFAGVDVDETIYINASDFAGNYYAEAQFTDIPAGCYSIKETTDGSAAPAWSVSSNAVQDDVTVSEDYDNTVYFTNVMNYGSVRVQKTVEIGDASENELKNAENFTFVLSGKATAGFEFTQIEYMNVEDFTGNTATLTFDNVPVGNYTVTESFGETAAKMWSVDGDASKDAEVTANSVTDVSYLNILGSGSVTVTKELEIPGDYATSGLKNSSFTFTLNGTDSGSTVERSLTLDADSFTNGKASATFTDVPYGNYVVTETMEDFAEASWTPTNGREQTTAVTVEDSEAEVTFRNGLNTGSLTVVKSLDADDYDLSSLDNATFTFVLTGESYAGISINQSVTVSASDFAGGDTAYAIFNDIPVGTYIITEETDSASAPAWSVSENAVQDAAVSANENNTVYFTNSLNYGSVYVNKIIDTGNALLSEIDNFGVFTFTLTGKSTAGINITQSRDISKGDFNGDLAQVSFEGIPVGSYKITESISEGSADMWTVSNGTNQDVDVESHGESTVTFTNVLGSGSVTVEKELDIASEYDVSSLRECTFTFTMVGANSNSSIVRTAAFGPESFKDGKASVTFDEIPYGTYVVTETMEHTVDACWTPVNGRIQTVTISPSNSTDTAKFENKLNTGDLTVVKYLDEDDFEISSLEDVTFKFTLTGESYAGISIDQYVEISAADFGDGDTAYAQFTDIPVGSYVITETSDGKATPAWSVSENAVQDAVVAVDDNNTVYFTNVLNYGGVQVYKDIDIGNAGISDIENSGVFTFTLSGISTAGIDITQSQFVTLDDFSGTRASVMFDNIPVGSYDITEDIEDPANMWTVSGDSKKNVDVETGETATVEYENIMSTGSITVTKELRSDYDVSVLDRYSFTFTVRNVNSESSVVRSVTFAPSDFTDGKASETFTDIPYGTYIVTETMDSSVSDDWTPFDGTQKIVILSSESTNGNETAEFTNILNTGDLTVVKNVEAGEYDISSLNDVTFVFALTGTSNAGVDIDTQLSINSSDLVKNGTASVTFKDIPIGTYLVTETSEGDAAPAWSVSENASQEATVSTNAETTAWFTNSLNIGTITVIKNIESGTYNVADIDTDDHFTFILSGSSVSGVPVSKTEHIYLRDFSDKTASVTFDNVPIGYYTVTEDKGSFSQELWSVDGEDSADVNVTKGENADVTFTNRLNLGSITVSSSIDMKEYTADELEYTYFTFLLEGTANSGVPVYEELMISAKDLADNEGSVTFENIPYGTYNVYEYMTAEVDAEWTCIDGTEKQVTVSSEEASASVYFANELNTGDLTVVKTLESGEYDLSELNKASFTFTLSGTSDVGITIEEQLSVNADDFAGGTTAMVTFDDIPVGSYIIEEETNDDSVPAWSVSGNAVQNIEITANSTSISYFTNSLNVGEVTVIKNIDTGSYSADGIEDYEYFTFVLEGQASSGINISKSAHVSVSDFSHGTASVTFTDVPAGAYTVSEDMNDLSSELWNIAGDGIVSVDVEKGENREVTFTNQLKLGSVQVNKLIDTDDYDSDNLEYTYFTFVLEGTANSGIHVSETKMISAHDFADDEASVTFDNIPYGTYDIYEVMTDEVAEEWACIDGTEKQVTVSASTQDTDVSFTNKLNEGNLTVVKELDSGDYDISDLENVTFVFTLSGTSDVGMHIEQTVSVSSSDLAGDGTASATFEHIPLGTYIVTESSEGSAAPAWSVSGKAIQEATVTANATSTVWFSNSLNVGQVTVIKNIDAGTYDMSEIDGGTYFTFVLSGTSDSGVPIEKNAHIYMSDFDSKTASVTFEDIPVGTYTVTENMDAISEKLWSVESDSTVDVDVVKGENAEAAFTNQLNCGSVTVTKFLDMYDYTANDMQDTYFTFILEGTADIGVTVSEELMLSANDFVDNVASVTFENIPYGTYNVYEVITDEVAEEWTCESGVEKQVTVSADNQDSDIAFTNLLRTGDLKVVKNIDVGDYDISTLDNFEFIFDLTGISDKGIHVEKEVSIPASSLAGDGVASATFEHIPLGTYTVTESNAGNASYSWSIAGDVSQEAAIEENATSTVWFTNILNVGQVTVVKNIDPGDFDMSDIDEEDYFTFVLSGTSACGIPISQTAYIYMSDFEDNTASVTFDNIPFGSYTVTEELPAEDTAVEEETDTDDTDTAIMKVWSVVGDDTVNVEVDQNENAYAEFTNILNGIPVPVIDDESDTQSSGSNGSATQYYGGGGSSVPYSQGSSVVTTSAPRSSSDNISSSAGSSDPVAYAEYSQQSSDDDYLKGDYQVQTGDDFNGVGVAVSISMIAALLALGFRLEKKKKPGND